MTASATGSATTSATGKWVSVTQAARLCRVSARTVHRWVATEEVDSELTPEGYRRIRAGSLPAVSEGVADSVADTEGGLTGAVADSVAGVSESELLTPPRHEAEGACCKVWERQVTTLEEQLEQRAEELRRRDQAEGELRRLTEPSWNCGGL